MTANFAQEISPFPMLRVGEKGFAVLPPVHVADGYVSEIRWSNDGRLLQIDRVEIPHQVFKQMLTGTVKDAPSVLREMSFWSAERRTFVAKWSFPAEADEVEVAILSDNRVAYGQMRSDVNGVPLRTLWRIDLTNGRVTEVGRATDWYSRMSLIASPTQPHAIWALDRDIVREDRKAPLKILYRLDGSSEPVLLGSLDASKLFDVRVSTSGQFFAVSWETGRPTMQPIDPRSGALGRHQPYQDEVFIVPPATPRGMVITSQPIPGLTEPHQPPIEVIHIAGNKKGDEDAIVAVGADRVELSPTGNFIAIVYQGQAMVREIAPIDPKHLEETRQAAKRTILVSNAKQVGAAFLMFAQDHDDLLPAAGGDWQAGIMPYLRNASIMEGFVYVFEGGYQTTIEAPADTILGYIPGAGGRAVVYADGSARWIRD